MKTYNSNEVIDVFMATLEELWCTRKSWLCMPLFNERNKAVEWFFILSEDITFKILDTTVWFTKWERIRVGLSKKLDESSLSQLLLDLDLRIANIRTNETNSYLQVLVGSKKK
jgi:uncharacterized SAM-dependent methyltransferase